MAQREIIKLKVGDTITPVFPVMDEATGEELMAPGEPFVLTEPPTIGAAPVPTGEYVVSFEATDFAGNTVFTDWTVVELVPPAPEPTPEVETQPEAGAAPEPGMEPDPALEPAG